MELLRTEFDDKRYPHKYLLTVPDMGGLGLILRLSEAAENLGFDMPLARQRVGGHESADGQPHYLVAVALTHESQYAQLLTEVDRLSGNHHKKVLHVIEETQLLSHGEQLLQDYEEQAADTSPELHTDHQDERKLTAPVRDDLQADYEAQIRSEGRQMERRVLDGLEL